MAFVYYIKKDIDNDNNLLVYNILKCFLENPKFLQSFC